MFGMEPRERCDLCERHRKLKTRDGMALWIEWDETDQALLCVENGSVCRGANVLRVNNCPFCGKECKLTQKQEANYEQKKPSSSVLWEECRAAGTTAVSER